MANNSRKQWINRFEKEEEEKESKVIKRELLDLYLIPN
jgi:hypothetical protein